MSDQIDNEEYEKYEEQRTGSLFLLADMVQAYVNRYGPTWREALEDLSNLFEEDEATGEEEEQDQEPASAILSFPEKNTLSH